MGVMGEEIVVSGTVREVEDGVATVDSQAEQSGRRIIRNAVAEVDVVRPERQLAGTRTGPLGRRGVPGSWGGGAELTVTG